MTVVDADVTDRTAAPRRSRTSRRLRWILVVTAVVDLAIVAFALLAASHLRTFIDVWAQPQSRTADLRPGLVILAVWMALLAVQGAYSMRGFAEGPDEYRAIGSASLISAGVFGLGCYLLQVTPSRGFVVLSFLIGTPLLLLGRWVVRQTAYSLRRSGHLLHRVLAVGGVSGVVEVVDALRRDQQVGYRVVGACLPSNIAFEPERLPVPVVGRVDRLPDLVDEIGADTVLVARGGYQSDKELRQIAWQLEGSEIDLVVVPSLTDVAGPRIHVRPVAGLPLLHVEQPQAGAAGGIAKRTFDILGATGALLMLLPVMALVALLIRLGDNGPVLFKQPRIGRDGSVFGCLKFRSMCVDAERLEAKLRDQSGHGGALWKLERDPRITRVGAFIRRYSIDELPQLFNVFRGEMSLVGPRPQQAWEVETYTDWEHRRLRVRPGMTGLWQVSGRSQLSFDEAIRLDLYYVDNWSMTQDLTIMAKTVRAVFGKVGAY